MTGLVLLTIFLVLTFLGVPVAYSMGIASMTLFLYLDLPAATLFTRTVASVNSSGLLAIPFFIVAGDILTSGGLSKRLIDFANSLFGWARGGLAMVNVGASVLFGGVSGSAAADTVAVGGVMIPAMKKEGYTGAFAAAVTAASSNLGPIIPPSILFIIYGGITGVSIGSLFIAGIVPGLTLALGLTLIAWWIGRKQVPTRKPFSLQGVFRSSRRAFLALLMPTIMIVGILAGAFTATEAGVIVVTLASIIAAIVYRDLSLRDSAHILLRSVVVSSTLMLIVAMAAGLAFLMAYARIPQDLLALMTGISADPRVVMLMVIAFCLVVGMFIETISAAIITVPVLFPLGEAMGYDPVHFALVIVMTLLIGQITPPLGVMLYVAAGIARVSVVSAIRAAVPFITVMIAVTVLIAMVPQLVTFLPGLMQ